MYSSTQSAIESRARRAAQRVGLKAYKSRWRVETIDNCGGFMLLDAGTGIPQAGFQFDMDAEEVIAFCAD